MICSSGGALFSQGPIFSPGEVFQVRDTLKMGTVKKLRNDNWEQVNNWPQNIYYYHVNFNDGSFETYLPEDMMVKLNLLLQHWTPVNQFQNLFPFKDQGAQTVTCFLKI
jgi:hypothetical protein